MATAIRGREGRLVGRGGGGSVHKYCTPVNDSTKNLFQKIMKSTFIQKRMCGS